MILQRGLFPVHVETRRVTFLIRTKLPLMQFIVVSCGRVMHARVSAYHQCCLSEPKSGKTYYWTSLERDEAGRRCVALPILVQKDEGSSLSLAGPPGLAVFLRDLDSDRRAKTETELLWYYVASPNPCLPMA